MWDSRSGDTGHPDAWGDGSNNTKMVWTRSTTEVLVTVSVSTGIVIGHIHVTPWWYDEVEKTWTADPEYIVIGTDVRTLNCQSKTRSALFIELSNFSVKKSTGSVQCSGNRIQPGYNPQAALPPQKQ
jgi:hypothetical protein